EAKLAVPLLTDAYLKANADLRYKILRALGRIGSGTKPAGEAKKVATFQGVWGPVRFSPDGTLMATETIGGIKLFEVRTWKERAHLKKEDARVGCFSADGKLLAAVSASHAKDQANVRIFDLMIWDLTTSKQKTTLTCKCAEHSYAIPLGFSADA